MAGRVARDRVFWPAPLCKRGRIELELARRRVESAQPRTINLDAATLDRPLMHLAISDVVHLESTVLAHVLKRRQIELLRSLRETRYRVLENPSKVLVDGDLFARAIGRFEELADAESAVRIDFPRERDPELG